MATAPLAAGSVTRAGEHAAVCGLRCSCRGPGAVTATAPAQWEGAAGPGCVMPRGHPRQSQLQGGFVAKPSQAPQSNPVVGRAERSRSACLPRSWLSFTRALPTGLAQLFPPAHWVHHSSSAPPKGRPAWVLGVFLPAGIAAQPGTGSQGDVGRRAAWQEAFLTPGLCLWRTLELSRCTAVFLVLALSSWAGSPPLKARLQVWC